MITASIAYTFSCHLTSLMPVGQDKKASDTPRHQFTAWPVRMCTAITPRQWQPWTAVLTLLGLIGMA